MVYHHLLKKLVRYIKKRVTLIDVVVLCLVAIFAIFFGLFFLRSASTITIRVRVTDTDVLYSYSNPQNWYADIFQVNDEEVDTLGKPLATITNIETFNIDTARKAVYLDMKVKAVYDSRTKRYSFKGKPIIFGSPLSFSLNHVFFNSIIVGVPDSVVNREVVKLNITAQYKDAPPYIAEATKKMEGTEISNNQGKPWIIINKVDIKPSNNIYDIFQDPNNSKLATVGNINNLKLKKNDDYSNIYIQITVFAKKINNDYFAYEDVPIRIGDTINIFNDTFTISPLITSIATF